MSTLPTKSNILSTYILDLVLPGSEDPRQCIAATTADRRLNLLDPFTPSSPLLQSYGHFQDSPLLDLIVINNKFLLAASMSGKLVVYNSATDKVTDERKDHSKYIVKLATWSGAGSTFVASASWDAKVHLYKLSVTDDGIASLGEPLATLTLATLPETILFVDAPEASLPVLLVTRRDSTYLHYYEVAAPGPNAYEMTLLGKQNLAPHSNAWVAFSPSDVQICPTDPFKVAVATSSTPHMKLLVVRLLVPPSRRVSSHPTAHTSGLVSSTPVDSITNSEDADAPLTQASQARAELVVADREEAAIMVNINTMAPQTAYSTPRLVWRPDGSGIYVTSDDGIIRGFEASSGKNVASLNAHEPGSKIRCLWAGTLKGNSNGDADHGKECLLSGGFDQKLVLWRTV